MDEKEFDRLARRVGTQANRRTMLRAAAGGGLALFGLGAMRRQVAAADGREGSQCFTNSDCETGLICQGASSGLLGGLIASGIYGPPGTGALFGPRSGTCRYRDGGCAKSGQFCRNNGDCCNGLNLICRNDKCQRDN